MLRVYQRIRPGVFKDQTVRKEIEKMDRWIQAASPLLKNVSQILAPGATPTGNSGSGSPGGGTLADHNHSRSGQGGNTLGDDTTQMEAQGNWYYDDKIGIKNVVPVGRLHIGIGTGTIDLGVLAVLQACASQTSDLLQARDSASAVKAALNPTFQLALGRSTARSRLDLQLATAAEIGVTLQAAASQSGNLFEVRNSGGSLIGFQLAKQGHVGINASPSDTNMLNAFLAATVTANATLFKVYGEITDNGSGLLHLGTDFSLILKGSGDYSTFEQIGFSSTIEHQGTNIAQPDISGARFSVKKTNTGNVGFLTAMFCVGEMSNTGTVIQYTGNYIANPARTGGSCTGAVGLYIEQILAGVSNYSIKCLGGLMYHAGKIGINIDPPTAMLHAVQDASATIGIKVRRNASGSTGDLLQILDQASAKLSGFDAKGRLVTPVDGVTTPIFNDITTTTKKLGIDASGITAATSKYWGALDLSGVLAITGDQAPAVSAGRLGKIGVTAQAAAIGATDLTNGAKVGYYVVHYTLEDTTADVTAGTIQVQVGYTDDIGATTQVGAALPLTVAGRDRGSFQVYLASGELSYQTNLVGIIGTSRYALRVRVQFLG